MRKVDVIRPPINYVVYMSGHPERQLAWFLSEEDAEDFWRVMVGSERYEIAEVRR